MAGTKTLPDALPGSSLAWLLLLVLVATFWWPALGQGKLLVYGDSGIHGLPALFHIDNVLAGRDSLLWSNRIFGGHPMLAEGQDGFFNPMTLIPVWLAGPSYALGLIRTLDMLACGAGMFALCRVLGISRWSAHFAALAVVFSGIWLSSQQNLPISASLTWVPWLIAGGEYWLKQPGIRSAILWSIPAALLMLSGYPQIAHGALLFVLASVAVRFFQEAFRNEVRVRWRAYLGSGLLAVSLACALAAVQLAPQMELVTQSNRHQGAAMFLWEGAERVSYFDPIQLQGFALYLKGLLFLDFGEGDAGSNAASLANITACGLVALLPLFRIPARLMAQAVGALLLFNLGMGVFSPFFRFVYAHHLIPGLHLFRTAQIYLAIAIVGIVVIAAHVLDALSENGLPSLRAAPGGNRALRFAVVVFSSAAFGGLCAWLYVPTYSLSHFVAPVLLAFAVGLLHFLGRSRWIPAAAVLVMAMDIMLLRVDLLNFQDRNILEPPPVIRQIAQEADIQDYHVMDASIAGLFVFLAPSNPDIGKAYRKVLATLSPFTSAMYWGIPTIDGTLALWLARRDLLIETFNAEIEGRTPAPPGLRMIDYLGIRYISRDATLAGAGLSLYAHDPQLSAYVYRNPYARPRFQVFWEADAVEGPAQALAALKAARSERLFVERRSGGEALPSTACAPCPPEKPAIEIIEARPTNYRVNVEMPREGWLFLSDADYPGWQAEVNGEPRPLHAAQVLGKAVHLMPGHNRVTICYVPRTFHFGAALSVLALLSVLGGVLGAWRSSRRDAELAS